jgi:hypothetical protein
MGGDVLVFVLGVAMFLFESVCLSFGCFTLFQHKIFFTVQ